jgi:hypothetical protein
MNGSSWRSEALRAAANPRSESRIRAETSDGAAKEREKRGFGGRRGDAAFKGCTRDVDATHRVSRFSGPSVGFTGIRPVLLQVLLFLHRNRAVIQLM